MGLYTEALGLLIFERRFRDKWLKATFGYTENSFFLTSLIVILQESSFLCLLVDIPNIAKILIWNLSSGLLLLPGGGNGNPLQYSCLENLMDREAWWVTVHGVTKSWTWLSDFTHFTHSLYLLRKIGLLILSSLESDQADCFTFYSLRDWWFGHFNVWCNKSIIILRASLLAQTVKNLPAMQES